MYADMSIGEGMNIEIEGEPPFMVSYRGTQSFINTLTQITPFVATNIGWKI